MRLNRIYWFFYSTNDTNASIQFSLFSFDLLIFISTNNTMIQSDTSLVNIRLYLLYIFLSLFSFYLLIFLSHHNTIVLWYKFYTPLVKIRFSFHLPISLSHEWHHASYIQFHTPLVKISHVSCEVRSMRLNRISRSACPTNDTVIWHNPVHR